MRKCLLTLLVINAVVFAYYRYDEALDPRLAAWRSEVDEQSSGESDAFYLLWGLSVGATERFIEHGKSEFEQYSASPSLHLFDGKPAFPYDYRGYAKLLEENPLFCRLEIDSVACLDALLLNKTEWPQAMSQFEAYQRGYHQFLLLDDYRNLTQLQKYQWEPFYPVLELGQRLVLLEALTLWQEGRSDEASAMLVNDVRLLRQHLPEVQSAGYLQVLLIMLEADLVLLEYVAKQSARPLPAFEPISLEEIPIERIVRREIVDYSYELYPPVTLTLISSRVEQSVAGRFSFELRRMFGFRPRMTVNRFFAAAASDASKALTFEYDAISATFNPLGEELLAELFNGRYGWQPVNYFALVERMNTYIGEWHLLVNGIE